MLNKALRDKRSYFIIVTLIVLLVGIRAFERQLFYDPFLLYFEGDYINQPLPEFDSLLLFLGLSFRFFLNTVLSLGILYFLFKDKEMILFASALYLFLFLILIVAFFSILHFYKNQENLMLFYVRRFLIQPLFVILFIPAFYYQKLKN